VIHDMTIAARLHWRYEWVAELPRDVYDILSDELARSST
jgi:hypothetical protein